MRIKTNIDLLDHDENDNPRTTLAGCIGVVFHKDGNILHVCFPNGGWHVFGPEDRADSFEVLADTTATPED